MTSQSMQIVQSLIAAGKSRQVIALEIGYSRPAVSRYTSGTYGADVGEIEAAILARYSRYECPYLGQEISPAECAANAGRAVPTASPRAVRHWKSCQTCPNKPSAENNQNKEPSCKPQ